MIVWLTLLKVAGILLVVDTASVLSFDLPKSQFSRALAWILAGLLAIAVIRFGTGVVPRSRLLLLAGAFLAVAAAAALFAENRYVGLFGEWKRFLGLSFVADMVVLTLAVAVGFRRGRDWIPFAWVVGWASVVTVAYAVVQRAGLDPVRWADDPRARPFATLGNPDIYGQLLSVVMATAVAVILFATARRAALFAAAVLIGAIGVSAVVATRGSALGVGTALVVALAIFATSRRLTPPVIIKLAGGVIVVAFILAVVVATTPLGARLRDTVLGIQVTDRLVIYKAALEATAARPILGWGPDGMASAYPHFSQAASVGVLLVNSFVSSAHSWVLQTAVTLGIPGLVVMTTLILATAVALWRRLRGQLAIAGPFLVAFVAYWAHGLVTVGSISVDWVPWVIVGGTAGLSVAPEPVLERRRVPGLVAGSLALTSIAVLTGVAGFAAGHDALLASLALNRDPRAAVSFARSAVARDAGRAQYWTLLGRAYDAAGQWGLAGDAHAAAAAREPYDPTNWEALAVSRTRQVLNGDASGGGREAALSAARTAAAVDQYNSAGYIVQAEVDTAFGEYDAGFAAALTALRLAQHDSYYRDDPNYARVAADAALGTSDLASAQRALEDLALTRETAPLRVAIGRVALKRGDSHFAVLNARRALEIDPTSADAKALLIAAGG